MSKDDGVSEAIPGGTTTYTIIVSNDGPNADPDVLLTDDLPDILSCAYTSVASGGAAGNTVSDTLHTPAIPLLNQWCMLLMGGLLSWPAAYFF